MLFTTVNYEKIEITPNGTTIEVPANQTKYHGDIDSVKIWNWDNGVLVTYNSHEDDSIIKLTGFSFNAMNELIKKGELQNIDGFTCYVINADELLEVHLFDIIKVNYNGKFYCIPLSNETTQDNLIICCNDKDIALHMAKSVKYKNVYPKDTTLDDVKSTIENVTGNLSINQTDLDNVKTTIENKVTDLNISQTDLDNVKTSIENKTREYLSKNPIRL